MPGVELTFSELAFVSTLASIGEFPTACGDDRQPGDAVAVASVAGAGWRQQAQLMTPSLRSTALHPPDRPGSRHQGWCEPLWTAPRYLSDEARPPGGRPAAAAQQKRARSMQRAVRGGRACAGSGGLGRQRQWQPCRRRQRQHERRPALGLPAAGVCTPIPFRTASAMLQLAPPTIFALSPVQCILTCRSCAVPPAGRPAHPSHCSATRKAQQCQR